MSKFLEDVETLLPLLRFAEKCTVLVDVETKEKHSKTAQEQDAIHEILYNFSIKQ